VFHGSGVHETRQGRIAYLAGVIGGLVTVELAWLAILALAVWRWA
jgi:hypothetical protein